MALLPDKVIKRFEALEGQRGSWEGVWRQCAEYVLPRLGQHNKTNQAIFDSTAPLAVSRFAAALESILTPRTQKWHGMTTGDPKLDARPAATRYLDEVRDSIFRARYAPEANFANQITECYLSLGVLGTAVMLVDDDLGRGISYQCIPLLEVYLGEDSSGRVDTVFRAYKLTARQAAQEFGEELPEKIRDDAQDAARMDTEYEFLHGVFPRKDFDRTRADSQNMPITSVHIARAARKIVREGGYRVMPYAVSRFQKISGDVYGRSPAMDVMADIIQVNAIKKTVLRAGEKMVNPPLLTPDDDISTAWSLKAGSLNPGGVDSQGRQLVVPLQIGGQLPIGLEMAEQCRKVINEAYYINLFQILVDAPQKTATEVVERAQEKAQLLAPVTGRQQSELLRPIINRETDILAAAGVLPPPPEELRGAAIDLKYETAMAKALDNGDAQSTMQGLQLIMGLAQVDQETVDILNGPEAARRALQALGVPQAVIRSEKEVKAIQQARQQAQQQEAMMQQAQMAMGGLQAVAGAEKDLQAAQAMAQGLRGGGNA